MKQLERVERLEATVTAGTVYAFIFIYFFNTNVEQVC